VSQDVRVRVSPFAPFN